jgi:hypothetical protein
MSRRPGPGIPGGPTGGPSSIQGIRGNPRRRAILLGAAVVAVIAIVAVLVAVLSTGGGAATPPPAVKGFDEAGVSAGTGDNFTAAQWSTIRRDGFRVFLTDPITYGSECSDGACTHPVGTCAVNPAAIAQIQDAYHQGIDYAVYARNPNCLTTAIRGLPAALQAHLSFALIDVEAGPGVPVTNSLIRQVHALGQTPVIYSYPSAWQTVMHGSSAFSASPLQDGQAPSSGSRFPGAYPAGYPAIVRMPVQYGGWSGYDAQIEQVQLATDVRGPAGAIGNPADQIDLDAVNAAWLASLPHHA